MKRAWHTFHIAVYKQKDNTSLFLRTNSTHCFWFLLFCFSLVDVAVTCIDLKSITRHTHCSSKVIIIRIEWTLKMKTDHTIPPECVIRQFRYRWVFDDLFLIWTYCWYRNSEHTKKSPILNSNMLFPMEISLWWAIRS